MSRRLVFALIVLCSMIVPPAPTAQADDNKCDHYRRSQKQECQDQRTQPTAPPAPSRTTAGVPKGPDQPLDLPLFRPSAEALAKKQKQAESRLIVKFRPGRNVRSASVHVLAGASSIEETQFPDRVVINSADTRRSFATYQASSDVLWVEQDEVVVRTDIPNDQDMDFSLASHLNIIHAPQAWDVTHGSADVKIGFVDSGVYGAYSTRPGWWEQYSNPDLRDVIIEARDFTGSPFGTDDIANHGTATASVAVGQANNIYMGAGVAYRASLIVAKVLGDDGFGFSSTVQDGMKWNADQGARIINASLGSSFQETPCSASYQDTFNLLWEQNVVIIVAAGNNAAKGPTSPASCRHAVAVGATNQSDVKADFSNYGPGVHLAAPGFRVITYNHDARLSRASGTSLSAPIVTGVAGLILAKGLAATAPELTDRLFGTSDRIAGTGDLWQYGRINAARAVSSDYTFGCSQRPNVSVHTQATSTPDQLLVTVTTHPTSMAANALKEIAFTPQNAVVLTTGGQPKADPFVWTAPAGATNMQFLLQRKDPGPFQTQLIATDKCGPWSSLAGAGKDFR